MVLCVYDGYYSLERRVKVSFFVNFNVDLIRNMYLIEWKIGLGNFLFYKICFKVVFWEFLKVIDWL